MTSDATGRSADEPIRIDAAFVLALALGLRTRGLIVPPGDVAACIELAALQPAWPPREIAAVLAPLIAREPGQRAIFAETFERVMAVPTQIPRVQPEAAPPFAKPLPPLQPGLVDRVVIAVKQVMPPAARVWEVTFGCAAIAGAGALVWWLPLNEFVAAARTPGSTPGGVWDWTRFIWSAVIATFLIVAASIATRVFMRARATRRGDLSAMVVIRPADDRTRLQAEPDGSVFRIGSLGGIPPPFLSDRSGIAIAEMIGVRLGRPDPQRLDAQRTIEERIRAGDPSLIVMAQRREMPSILLLHDTTADSQHWNTLPDEFESILERRGVPVHRLGYPRTLHEVRGGLALPRQAAQVLEDAIAGPGWTVTTIFGDAASLVQADRELLRRAAENGPVVFLDSNHPLL